MLTDEDWLIEEEEEEEEYFHYGYVEADGHLSTTMVKRLMELEKAGVTGNQRTAFTAVALGQLASRCKISANLPEHDVHPGMYYSTRPETGIFSIRSLNLVTGRNDRGEFRRLTASGKFINLTPSYDVRLANEVTKEALIYNDARMTIDLLDRELAGYKLTVVAELGETEI